MGVAASAQETLSGVICMAASEGDLVRREAARRPAADSAPVMPVLTMPKLPKLTPGKPLDPEQRRELVALQQQIQEQLRHQRVLVESIRQQPQFRDIDVIGHSELARENSFNVQHVLQVGVDPVGDSPIEDPDTEDESKSIKSNRDRARENDDQQSNSTLGTTTKVYVDFHDHCAPEAKKDDLSSLLELDALMKRGGASGEDTGEPSIQSPRSLPGNDLSSASQASSGSRRPKDARQELDDNFQDLPDTAEEFPENQAANDIMGAAVSMQHSGSRELTDGFKQADNPIAPRRPMPSAPPLKERSQALLPVLGALQPADLSTLGATPPSRAERRWIETAVRRMFRSLDPVALESITEAFREWKLEAGTAVVKQQSPINTGPGLCVLFEGVVDVLHRPMGATTNEKVCTYDRCGQCFGELELLYDAPRGQRNGRKNHWATIATRTPVTLWTIHRDTLRGIVPGAAVPGAATKPTSQALTPVAEDVSNPAY